MPPRKRRKTAGPTILDYLNDDCWKCVLDYVDLKEVILSERVSRRWQAVVLRYMQTVRLALEEKRATYVTHWPKVRCLKLNDNYGDEYDWASFEHWTEKLGSTVVAAYSTMESRMKILLKNCPNVECLTIMAFPGPISHDITTECFQRLRRLCFRDSLYVTDRFISQLINSSVTELEVHGRRLRVNDDYDEDDDEDDDDDDDEDDDYEYDLMEDRWIKKKNKKIKGRFLNRVKSMLESLTLININLQFYHLHSVVDRLSELKKLHLSILPQHVFENVHLVLDKTPKLEYLQLKFDYGLRGLRELDLSKHVCRLANLRHLSGDAVRTDEHLEVVTRDCKELRTLEIRENEVSVRGLEAMVRNAGARLVALELGWNNKLTDDDMMVCFRGCTKLTTLTVKQCGKLSGRQLREVAAAARRGLDPRPPPLHLLKHNTPWIIE